ncbi:unnamed protein product [Cylicocyclus nassatus]|uniref:Uncharacterized protein n=1 Tax=Cylicocyclus nassatus TaxID=53992 RepID=A0AA36MHY0_CYLNA|nr:unnamed protein product [Cylicocyclus nassatus]
MADERNDNPDHAAEEMNPGRELYPIYEEHEIDFEDNGNNPEEQEYIEALLYEATIMMGFLTDTTTEYMKAASVFFFRNLFSSQQLIINDPASYTDLGAAKVWEPILQCCQS